MNNKTRKRIWPVPMAAVIGAIAMLAMLAIVALPAGTAQAQPADPGAPKTMVGSLAASPMETSVNLTWTAATEGAFPISRHQVEYQTTGASSWTTSADNLAADATSHRVAGLTASTSYMFRVRAVAGSRGQFEGPWATISATTTASGGTPGGGEITPPTDDCEIAVNAAGTMATVPSGGCSAQGDTAEVVVMGSKDATEDATLSLLIADAAGPITAYPNGTIWSGGQLVDANGVAAKSMRYRFQSITVPKAKANPTTGIIEGQKVTLMVKGDVYVWEGSVSVTDAISGIPSGNAASGSREIADNAKMVDITFLGVPAIGKDRPDDDNKTLDAEEVRSRLDADDAPTFATAEASVEDGTEADITLTGNASAVTIRATIRDAKNQNLKDVEVTFAATSVPAGIENRTRSYDSSSTGIADHTISGLPTDKPYRVTVVVTAGKDNPLTVGTIVIARAGDLDAVMAEACAMVTGDETDTKMDGCMAGYNAQMIYGPGDGFSIYAKAADSRGTKVTPDTFMVKPATAATWWDALDCMEMNDAVMPTGDEPAVGPDDSTSPYCKMYAGLSAEAKPVVMRAFGDAYGDATEAFDITSDGKNVPDSGMVALTVEDDAPGAKYLLDVIATTRMDGKTITKSDQVMVVVSGKLDGYILDGPDAIALGGSAKYMVTAMDENGNPPIFETGKNKVRVLVQPGDVLVTNLDAAGNLTLNTNTGMGSFEIFAPLDAMDGDKGRVIVGSGTMQQIMSITFGVENTEPMAGSDIDPVEMTVGDDPMTVATAFTDADGDMLTYSVDSSNHRVATATVNRMGVVTITAVGAGDATITVTANDGRGGTAMSDISVMVSAPAPMELTAPTNVRVNPVGSGGVIVAWDSVSGASGYRIIAINVNDVEEGHSEFVNNPMATSGGLDGLTPGATYNIFVASFDDADPPNYRLQTRFREIVAE